MIVNKTNVKDLLDRESTYRRFLYRFGFIATTSVLDPENYPFYGAWNIVKIGNLQILVSPSQNCYSYDAGENGWYVLIGHCMDPIEETFDENEILSSLGAFGTDCFWESFNRLTGIFTFIRFRDGRIDAVGDPCGIQTVYYCNHDGFIYVASHENLLGDLLDLKRDPYIQKLIKYRFFHLFGGSLPGDISQFLALKRLVTNHYVSISSDCVGITRFYMPRLLHLSNDEICERASDILSSTMRLIAKKWNRPAISLTGGCDSKTTLSCTNGSYDAFSYYSFNSSDTELVDALAAQKICKGLGLPHTLYEISRDDSAVPDVESVRMILQWNTGNICPCNANDVRKQAFFSKLNDFDVEVKSWVSEVGRAYYSKRFHGRKKFGKKPTPRKCTTLYKVFLHNRRLVLQTDRAFKDYLDRYFKQPEKDAIPWQEQFFWEFKMTSWNGGIITGEQRYSQNITIPYNNRLLLELLLSAPLESRINDEIYTMIRSKRDDRIDKFCKTVVNVKHTSRRAFLENVYYTVHTKIPF